MSIPCREYRTIHSGDSASRTASIRTTRKSRPHSDPISHNQALSPEYAVSETLAIQEPSESARIVPETIHSKRYASPIQSPQPSHRPRFDLLLISFLILFFELACIRWFAAYVPFLSFFTNIVLTAALVGMCVGCLAARRDRPWIRHLPWLWALATGLAFAVCVLVRVLDLFWIQVGNPADFDEVFFGAETKYRQNRPFVISAEMLGGVFFALITLMFVALGQVLGKTLNAVANRIQAYTLNITGSLIGIVAFSAISLLALPPGVWFLVFALGVAYFLRRAAASNPTRTTLLVVTTAVVALVGSFPAADRQFTWSPYYNIEYQPSRKAIFVNGLGHQEMYPLSESPVYSLPYWLARDAGAPPINDVLIIGAGSGNDVAHALAQGAQHIDAVEIDPVIAQLGQKHHPNRPYDDPRVTLHIDDGRAFLRKTKRKYDLIVYALVDSLTLHSAHSSIRLESYLFTQQAFADIHARLKEGGLFVAYNMFREGWVVARIHALMKNEFGSEPIVFTVPPKPQLSDTDHEPGFAILFAGNTEPLAAKFKQCGKFVLYNDAVGHENYGGFIPPDGQELRRSRQIVPASIKLSRDPLTPTDDWPFIYLKQHSIPTHNWIGLAVMAAIAFPILFFFAPAKSIRLNPHFLFLGAGFMLIETKNVTHMAVLFGSTWMVCSIVFFSILVMILLANLFVLAFKTRRLWPWYLCLFACLLLNHQVRLDAFLADDIALRALKSAVLLFSPIFFAGIIFATSFRDSPNPDLDFGANIAGVVIGGALEYLALVIGFGYLPLVALALYALSLVGLRRAPRIAPILPRAPVSLAAS